MARINVFGLDAVRTAVVVLINKGSSFGVDALPDDEYEITFADNLLQAVKEVVPESLGIEAIALCSVIFDDFSVQMYDDVRVLNATETHFLIDRLGWRGWMERPDVAVPGDTETIRKLLGEAAD